MVLVISMFLLFAGVAANAQNTIEVEISGIREQKGNLLVGLFNSEGAFLEKAVQSKVVKASSEKVVVIFENLNAGDYAVSIIHDENENGELDKNFIGIPKEGFAFGNNAMGTFGPPSFKDAKVTVTKEKISQKITLKYM